MTITNNANQQQHITTAHVMRGKNDNNDQAWKIINDKRQQKTTMMINNEKHQ